MTLKFLPAPEDPLFTTETYYDLFLGGYIRPEEMLEAEDAVRVRAAIDLIREFLDGATETGHLEEG